MINHVEGSMHDDGKKYIAFLRSAELLFQGVHTETTGSIPDDGKKYECQTLGSTHDDNGKYT
jgi:hypothetical protein